MNIVDQAKAIKRQTEESAKWAQKELNKKLTKEELFTRTRRQLLEDKVWDAIKNINDSWDFKVSKAESNRFGEIARLEQYVERVDEDKKLCYLGMICEQTDYSTFCGSDESPEQEVSHRFLTLQETFNSKDRYIAVSLDHADDNKGIDAAIKEFTKMLASFIATKL